MTHSTSPFGAGPAGAGHGSDPLVAAGRELLMDTASVMRTRRDLDKACLDVLAAPGLGGPALEVLTAFVTGPQLAAGSAALARIQNSSAHTQAPAQSTPPQDDTTTDRSEQGDPR